jgi:4-hydroxybenzoyl-CoA thioesterase
MHLSRYFEFLNTAIEEWFEDTLDTPFHELHVDRKIGIPTVQFNTRIRELPRSEDEVSIRFQPTKIGQRAMTFKSWLVSGDQCFVENEQVIVFVRMLAAGYESIPIPEYIREKFLEQLEISAVEK